jgi:acetoacetate decarboxylase
MNHDERMIERKMHAPVGDDAQIARADNGGTSAVPQGFFGADALPIAPTPWLVRGQALVLLGHLGRKAARQLAGNPRGFAAPPMLGSFAAVGLIAYTATPVGPYHELTVIPGILWRDLPGALVSHMLVDSARSVLAGRALWGLPKTLAHFSWQPHAVAVSDAADVPLLAATWQARHTWPRLAMPPLPMMTLRGPRRQLFTASGTATGIQRVRAQLAIPDASPLAPLAAIMRGPHLALWLDEFRLRLSDAFDLL